MRQQAPTAKPVPILSGHVFRLSLLPTNHVSWFFVTLHSDNLTTREAPFPECQKHSEKPPKHSGKASLSATLGEGVGAECGPDTNQ
jgi:hypothetical protein